jgi:hypothetical protein
MLLAIEGFEGFGTTTASDITTYLAEKFSDISAGPFYLGTGRYFGFSIYSSDTDQSQIIPFYTATEDSTIIIGFNFFCNAVTPVALIIFYAGDTPTLACTIKWSTVTAGELSIYDHSDTLLGTTSGAGVTLGTKWHYIEAKVVCDDSDGSIIIKVDGVTRLSLDGIDTSNASSDISYSKIGVVVTSQYKLDDFYIADGTGFNNDFLGEKSVVGCLPSSDTAIVQWTPSTGTTHYDLVNENPSNDDTNYVSDYYLGHADLYRYPIDTDITKVSGVQINTICRTEDGYGSIKVAIGSEGIEFSGSMPPHEVSSSYNTKIDIAETYPNVLYKKITISHTNVGDTLTDFPLCVKIDGDADIGAVCLSTGNDIFFTDSDFNALYAEADGFIVSGGAATGTFWVKIPEILSTSDTVLYCFYGGTSASARTGMTSVWNPNFKNIYHFGTSSSLILTDSTINANTATSSNVTAVAGRFNGAANFAGNGYLNVPTASLVGTAQFTMSYWIYITTAGYDHGIFSKGNASAWTQDMFFVMASDASQWYQIDNGADGSGAITTNPYSIGTWYRYSIIYDGTQADNASRHRVWRDGQQQTLSFDYTVPATTYASMPTAGYFGYYVSGGGWYLRGRLDEIHISNVARSPAWAVFDYYNQNSGEITWGDEQTLLPWTKNLLNLASIGIKI